MAATPLSEVEARIAHLHRVIAALSEERDLATRRALLAEDQAFLRLRADVQMLRDLYVLSRELNWWLLGRRSAELITWPPAARALHDALLLGDEAFGVGMQPRVGDERKATSA